MPGRPKRAGVVIAGASTYNLSNVSDDSMFEPLYRALRAALGEEPISLLCRHPERRGVGDADLRMYRNLDFASKALSERKRFRGFNAGDPSDHLARISGLVAQSRALILGGDPFLEVTLGSFRGLLVSTQMLVSLARFLETPVILFGIHLGRPPVSEYGRDLMHFAMDNADLITTREDTVAPTLRQMTETDLLAGADSGFSIDLDGQAVTPGMEAFIRDRIQERDYALVTLRSLYWKWRAPEREAFAELCAETIDRMFVGRGLQVVMQPHCTYDVDHPWEDDRAMHRLIRSRSARPESYLLFDGEATVGDTLRLHETARFVLSNRRHAGIFAALGEVPFLIFGERSHLAPIHHLLATTPFLDYGELTAERLGQAIEVATEESIQTAREVALQEREKSESCLATMADFVRVSPEPLNNQTA
jgi:polysaccharide pyruvyl transferase WcaK-like protein